ncbi:hypothetical protein [Streptomyces althioticus]|uniref:hypothetical protein n=1 Tax=Streptomyces althioticus TaxID=83380 RepID=UPI0033E0084A
MSHTVHAQAVRAGDAVAVYFAADGMAMVNGRTSDAKLPPAAVKARSAKLGRARDNRLHSPAHRTRGALT